MATENKSNLNNVLRDVLAIANQEQNVFYSPKIYSQHRNIIESLLLTALVRAFPSNPSVIDSLNPFVKVAVLPNVSGFIEMPEDYRNILGTPMIFAKEDNTGECGNIPDTITQHDFKAGVLKAGCRMNPVVIVPQSEFAYRTQSTYDAPDYENPIGFVVDQKRIKVCPYDISRVSVMYAKKERTLIYGYIQQPDDTYLYDETTTIDTEFDSAAYEPIFNAITALYFTYAKDPQMQNWAALLQAKGIL